MCTTILNTRFACFTRGCRPQRKQPLTASPHASSTSCLELRPSPLLIQCEYSKSLPYRRNRPPALCRNPHVTDSREVILLKSLECPKHHRRRMGNLLEAWDVEYENQIMNARPGVQHRRMAQAHKVKMNRQREEALKAMERDADATNMEFYGRALGWQYMAIGVAVRELGLECTSTGNGL